MEKEEATINNLVDPLILNVKKTIIKRFLDIFNTHV